ncbi:hypothetical protein LMG27174_05419 [Paraburkholderia rhynchosiae]|uniref:Uncharacterized protein n=1 Tax=Paraburkholderia rhynchosiae TaxID=487049 RepID=A0A6J5C8A8_9BURK|nr:hypothetical protein LMG27174_05419 [Paraburkholderia rhynchosiae]
MRLMLRYMHSIITLVAQIPAMLGAPEPGAPPSTNT